MDRIEMLDKLSRLRFCIFWPPAEWRDIGFTERPIWVNSQGYGYIGEDDYSEPCSCMQIEGIPQKQILELKKKMDDGSITYRDIERTSLVRLNDCYMRDEEVFLEQLLRNHLNSLPDNYVDRLYCEITWDGWIFFDSEENLIAYNEDEFCSDAYFGERWDSMDDSLLSTWYNRIFLGQHDMVLPITLGITRK